MSKLSSERFSSVSGFVEALAGRRSAGPSPNTARGPRYEPRKRRRGFPWKATLAGAVLAGVVYGVPPVRAQALEFWGGLVHAATLVRDEAQRLATNGAAAQPVTPVPATADTVLPSDTVASIDATQATDSTLAGPLELERAPLVLEESTLVRSPVGPAPFRMSGVRQGWIKVTVAGGTAPIIIDGRSYGSAPQIIRVDKGLHIVTVRGAGDMFMPFQHDVTVTEGDTVLAAFEVPVRRAAPVQPPPSDTAATPAPTHPTDSTTTPVTPP